MATDVQPKYEKNPFGPRLEASAGTGRGPLSGQVQAPLLSRRCRLCEPGGLRVPGGRRLQVRDPAACQSDSSTEDRLPAQAPCRSSSERGSTVLRQFQLSGAKLEDTAPRGCQGLSLIHISEPTRLGMISYAVFCLKKK